MKAHYLGTDARVELLDLLDQRIDPPALVQRAARARAHGNVLLHVCERVGPLVLRGVEQVDTGGRLAAVVQELACKPAPELAGDGLLSPRLKEYSRDVRTLLT